MEKVLIHNSIDELDINKDYAADYAIIGDAKIVLGQLIDEARKQLGGDKRNSDGVAGEIKTVKEQWLAEWMPKLTSDEIPINPYRVVWDLMQAVDQTQTIVTHDSGNPRDQVLPFYEAITPHGLHRLGKIHTVRIRTWIDPGCKDGRAGKNSLSISWEMLPSVWREWTLKPLHESKFPS